jgi:serine/threonine-protein kinase
MKKQEAKMGSRVDRDTFLRNLHQSGLLTPELAEALPRLPETDRGRVLARALVHMQLLTKFQAERLLAGVTTGFVLGQYRILELLGVGGMGKVYKAVHQTMNREVAIKILAPHLMKTSKAKDLFQKEVRAAARLIHPNIVTAFDANQIGDRYFLVMEYVDGPNLDQLVRERGALPVGLACEIIRQTANGLQYAHEMGMVHRDIKPANLLATLIGKNKDLVIKILDFGLARLHEPGARSEEGRTRGESAAGRSIMGTPDFLSPEQGEGGDVDIRSDLYSLGCTFYFLLTGRVPYPGGTSWEKLDRQKNEEPELVEDGRPEIPAAVASIVRRLMAKYPPHRFQTPAEIAAAVAPFAASESAPWEATGRAPGKPPVTDPALPSTGDLSAERALTGTLPPSVAPTPLSYLGLTPGELAQLNDRRHRRKTFFWAAGIVAAVGAAVTLLLVLMQ